MYSRRSFLHLGIGLTAALAVVSASPAYSAAYHGSARTGGRVVAHDVAARSFTVMRRNRSWTYHVSDDTRFLIGGKPAYWPDVKVGASVHVKWRRRAGQRMADIVSIRQR
jgi:hypothetical protein